MDISRLYIQQYVYDGVSYYRRPLCDTYTDFGIVCKDFPFVVFPETKDSYEEDWPDYNGKDVYIPEKAVLNDYDLEAEFIATSQSVDTIRTNIKNFISFLYGFNTNGSARLAIFEENTGLGRKDVKVVSVNNDLWWNNKSDDEKIATFKVKFHVYDPKTDVSVHESSGTVQYLTWTGLTWLQSVENQGENQGQTWQ